MSEADSQQGPTEGSQQGPTEDSQQGPTGGSQQGPTEDSQLEPTEDSHQGPTEDSHQGPTENSQQEPTKGSQQRPTEDSQQGPTGDSQQGPTKGSQQGPTEDSQQGPTEDSHQGPTEDSHQGPTENSQQEPTKGSQQRPTDDSQQGPTGDSQQGPTGDSQQGPTKGSQQGPTEDSQQGPTEDSQLGPTEDSQQGPTGDSQQGPTEDSQQGPTEDSQQGPSEDSQQGPTEDSHQGPTEDSQQGPTEDSQQGPTGDSQQGPTEDSQQGPTEDSQQGPTEDSQQGPTEDSQQGPTEDSQQGATVDSQLGPTEDSQQGPTEGSQQGPTEDSQQRPTEDSQQGPTEGSQQGPTEDSQQGPTEDSQQEPTEDSQLGPTEDSQQGPTGDSQQGPTEDSQQGPTGDSHQGPTEDSQQGPMEDSQQGPTEDSQLGPTKGSQQGPTEDSRQGPTEDSQQRPTKDSQQEPTEDSQQGRTGETTTPASGQESWAKWPDASDSNTGDGGVSAGDRNVSASGAGVSAGGVNTGDGGVSTGDGGVNTGDSGVSTGDGGVNTGDGGVSTGDGGVSTGDSGLSSDVSTGDGGVNHCDGGVSTGDSGVSTGDSGVSTGNSGVKLADPNTKDNAGGCEPIKTDSSHNAKTTSKSNLEDGSSPVLKSSRSIDSSRPTRARGYQETRRLDRDRRNNWRQSEKKSDKPSERETGEAKERESVADTETERKSSEELKTDRKTSQSVSKSKSESGQAVPTKASSTTDRRSQASSAREDRGRKTTTAPDRRADKTRGDLNSKSHGDSPKTKERGTELLSLLQQKKGEVRGGKAANKGKPGTELKGKGKTASDLEAKWQKEEAEKKKKEEEEQKRKLEEERKKIEEEQRKLEEARKKLEEEERRKRQEEEDARLLEEQEKKQLADFAAETKERLDWRVALREQNQKAAESRPDESFFGKLDSSLKKNTTFVKKLRSVTENQKESLSKDFQGLNLSKYIGEAAAAIVENKLKMSDVNCAVHLSCLLHQRYSDFSASLLENWQKVLLTKKDDKVPNPSKLRVDLRFFADLVTTQVFTEREGLPMLANQLMFLISPDKDEHNNLSIIISFCRHCGDDYAGLMPRKIRLLAEKYSMEIPRSGFLKAERQRACRNLLKEYFTSVTKHLMTDHKELRSMEKQNWKILQTKGELSTERKEKHEVAQQSLQKLLQNATVFADLMDEDLPEFPQEEFKTEVDEMGLDIYSPVRDCDYDGDTTLFEDEDTRQFYETLPDLKALIPGILYKDSEQTSSKESESEDNLLEEDGESLNVEDLEKELEEQEQVKEAELVESPREKSSVGTDRTEKDEESTLSMEDTEDDDTDIAVSLKLMLESFLASLPNCVNRDLIDKAAIDFCMNLNVKANRKKLTRTLFTVHRTRYDLLPFYARLVATLHPCMPDIASELILLLKGDFKWHMRKKDQINIESKLKTVRFIGELVKFKMFPKSEALHCLKMLMFDFSHHNIEMGCSLLESCGRFLYRSPDSHHRTKVYLDVMMRKKTALHLDSRYTALIENAYYYSKPPDVKAEVHKDRPPMHQYIRKLLYKDLTKVTTEKVLRQIRKLAWDDPSCQRYISKCLMAVWNIRYNSVHCCANLLAGLAPYHEAVAIQVVDGVLEDIRLGMELNYPKYNQRRVSCVKFLGEMYNYRLVESAVIFKTLYSFITFGVSLDDDIPSPLDPPEHLFRLRLSCVLLDTCGQYFDRGSSRRKLDCFLVYFQRYYWFKRKNAVWTETRPFPMDMEYLLKDTLESLRPKNTWSTNWEEACTAAEELDKEFRAKLAEVMPAKDTEDSEIRDAEADNDYGLATIQESDETDDLSQRLSLSQLHVTETTGSTQDSETDQPPRSRRDGSEDEAEGDEDNDDEDEDDSSDLLDSAPEDMEDEVMLIGGPRHVSCPEDDDFMAEFDKMLSDNIQARNQEATKAPQLDIAVPMHIKSQKNYRPVDAPPEPTDVVNFILMTKKGNKQQFATLNVPIEEEFASKLKEREEAAKMEKERMKKVTLDIHERQEEEDYQEMIASMSRPAMANINRDRKVKYQHPKGAPDADLIFGSKKR